MPSEIIVEFPEPLTDMEKKMIYGYKGEVVRCKDCKHKPTGTAADHDLEFPDNVCLCQCFDDFWYSWMPEDNFFCALGERREAERTVTYYADGKPIETIVIGEWGNDAETD